MIWKQRLFHTRTLFRRRHTAAHNGMGDGRPLPDISFTRLKHLHPASLLPPEGPHSVFGYASLMEAFPSPLKEGRFFRLQSCRIRAHRPFPPPIPNCLKAVSSFTQGTKAPWWVTTLIWATEERTTKGQRPQEKPSDSIKLLCTQQPSNHPQALRSAWLCV